MGSEGIRSRSVLVTYQNGVSLGLKIDKNLRLGVMDTLSPIIPVLWKLGEEDCLSKLSPGYKVSPSKKIEPDVLRL